MSITQLELKEYFGLSVDERMSLSAKDVQSLCTLHKSMNSICSADMHIQPHDHHSTPISIAFANAIDEKLPFTVKMYIKFCSFTELETDGITSLGRAGGSSYAEPWPEGRKILLDADFDLFMQCYHVYSDPIPGEKDHSKHIHGWFDSGDIRIEGLAAKEHYEMNSRFRDDVRKYIGMIMTAGRFVRNDKFINPDSPFRLLPQEIIEIIHGMVFE